MDAQIAADPTVAEHTPEPLARLSREPAELSTGQALREERAEPHVRLPGEPPSEPTPNGQTPDDEPGAVPDPSGARRMRRWKRRQIWLVGASVVALGMAAAGVFLVSPYNRVYPLPQMASAVRHWAAEAGVNLPEPLAPAASLAGVPVSPAEPVVREKYQPKKKDEQLQELLGFREATRAPESSPSEGQPQQEAVSPAVTTAGKVPAAAPASAAADRDRSASGRDQPPPAYVPSEPGSSAAAASAVESPVEATRAPSASQPPAAPSAPISPKETTSGSRVPARDHGSREAHGPGSDATAAVVASLPKPAEVTPSSTAAPAAAGLAERAGATPTAAPATDPVKTAGELRAAPLAPADQVQVLELVTQIAAIVKDLRTQDAQLRADFGKAAADNAARLADFERRLALTEARHAVSAAQNTGEPEPGASASAPPRPASPPAILVTRAEAESASWASNELGSRAATRNPGTARSMAKTGEGGSDEGGIKRYRVQAASPGLALLAEIDRGGGEGAQHQVLVGDTIPGYGRIKSIGQRGTAWVVETEHGNIQ